MAMQTAVTATHLDPETLQKLVCDGDLSKLTPEQQVLYYRARCESAALDYRSKPFELIRLNGKLQMYATKECTAQIANRDRIICHVVEQRTENDVRVVLVRAKAGDGRETDEIGCVNLAGLKGDNLCNAMMKAVTKAKRRAILSLGGLGLPDETELETIPHAAPHEPIHRESLPDDRREVPEKTAEFKEFLGRVQHLVSDGAFESVEKAFTRLGPKAKELGFTSGKALWKCSDRSVFEALWQEINLVEETV